MTPSELASRLRCLQHSGALDLPLPGSGATSARLHRLAAIAAADVSLARLAEAHTDATAILAEAGRTAVPDALYGVWASEDGEHRLELRETDDGIVLVGGLPFCSGIGLIDRALVHARCGTSRYLVDVDLNVDGIVADLGVWQAPAFSATCTGALYFDDVTLPADARVGGDGWYLARPGFWQGACGPAACWAGGAQGLVRIALAESAARPNDPHRLAHLGALAALDWQLSALLDAAGAGIDAAATDVGVAERIAGALRANVERAALSVIDHFGRAFGPRLLAFDADVARRVAEVQLYVRQHGGERDLARLGQLASELAGTTYSSTGASRCAQR